MDVYFTKAPEDFPWFPWIVTFLDVPYKEIFDIKMHISNTELNAFHTNKDGRHQIEKMA